MRVGRGARAVKVTRAGAAVAAVVAEAIRAVVGKDPYKGKKQE